jgi:putative endonuclease
MIVIPSAAKNLNINLIQMFVNARQYCVYIVTNYKKTVLYTGVTNNLEQRIIEHYLDRGHTKTFTGRYNAFYLLYYECTQYVNNAIAREKEIKGWSKKKKIELINSFNPQWKFLNHELLGEWPPTQATHRRGE